MKERTLYFVLLNPFQYLQYNLALEATVTACIDADSRKLTAFAPTLKGQCGNPK